MEIRDIFRLLQRPNPTPGSVAPSEADRHPSPRRAPGGDDAVQVSEQGRRLAELRKTAKAVPEVRQARVEELRRALRSGELSLHPEIIAQALLRQRVLRDLLGQ